MSISWSGILHLTLLLWIGMCASPYHCGVPVLLKSQQASRHCHVIRSSNSAVLNMVHGVLHRKDLVPSYFTDVVSHGKGYSYDRAAPFGLCANVRSCHWHASSEACSEHACHSSSSSTTSPYATSCRYLPTALVP